MKLLKYGLTIAAVFMVLIVIRLNYNLRDRHPDFNIDLVIDPLAEPGRLSVGFAKIPITPQVTDTWNDFNNNAKYEPEQGETYNDVNGNNKFDPVWIAGFHNRRPAQGVHDDLWARVMVLDDGATRIAITSIDAIGFIYDDAVDIRKSAHDKNNCDYTIISSTHVHQAPDLIGIWGESFFKSGVNTEYMRYVKRQTVAAIETAVKNLVPVKLRIGQDLEGAIPYVVDSRDPQEMDPGIRIIQAIEISSGKTLGSLVSWSNHPETLWSKNLLISSDFPHYFRESVENGVHKGDRLLAQGLGGITVFVNGAVGGLMTTNPSHPIPDPFDGEMHKGATFEKAQAQGQQLGLLALKAIRSADVMEIEQVGIKIRAKTISIPLDNWNFLLGFLLGVIDHGTTGWLDVKTEVAALRIGPISIITIPGEIYPEIINGGVVSPPGQDYNLDPVEIPPLRSMMPGKFKFVFGLANDEIGYIIPKSEWDEIPPYLYNHHKSPYGEVNSIGPEAGPIIHESLIEMLEGF